MIQKDLLGCAFLLATVVSGPAFADTISWTTWTTRPTSTSASGTLVSDTTPISVDYAGEIAFPQRNGIGTSFYQPLTTFTHSPTVPNALNSDIIAIDGGDHAHDHVWRARRESDYGDRFFG